jgi:hypothetical protein
MPRFLSYLPKYTEQHKPLLWNYQVCRKTPWIYQVYILYNLLLHYTKISLAEYLYILTLSCVTKGQSLTEIVEGSKNTNQA